MTSAKTISQRQPQPPQKSGTTTSSTTNSSPEATMHKLKLDWIMARDESERKRVSLEIRRQIGFGVEKKT